MQKAKIFLTS